ncbi:uncharacterized membrane-anchored protein YitT (DUF2179 family) [Psychrobacillus insolitus]|uniref:Uncharacterized membrane-anchored protein YitT (DUF2179 family) n=1 Tax=Psychrobacillus insolitus TaxID=1461 RepID=A0A2W7N860_9BACI|nr:YitT family protein [Psychrobacillus insolitus]PZX08233.1 uncharacterized membrane-anchored protein YitT (DUF2179 family) [Psychrobacillus insolitus]
MKRKQTTSKALPSYIEKGRDYVYVIIGAAIIAIAFNVFLLPNQIASGGVSGISTLLQSVFGWQPGIVQYAFNIPLFIAGIIFLGSQFGLKSFVGTLTLPAVVLATSNVEPWTMDPLLGAIFGGISVGLGLGIVFRGGASTGGTDLAAQIITKYTGFSLGTSVLMIDGLIVFSAALVFDIEKALFALISLFVTTKTIDIIQLGFSQSKMVYIFTNKQEEMRDTIYKEIDRGVTKIPAIGGYTEEERPILMVVVHQREFTKLKHFVKMIDPSAFVIVSDAHEVLGEGFKKY